MTDPQDPRRSDDEQPHLHSVPAGDQPGAEPSAAQLRADADRARARLAETVDQLAHKADVPSRVRARAGDLLSPTTVVVLGLAAVGASVVLVVLRRRRSVRRPGWRR